MSPPFGIDGEPFDSQGPPDPDTRGNPFGFDHDGDADRTVRAIAARSEVPVFTTRALAHFAAAPDCNGSEGVRGEPGPTDDPDDGTTPGDPCLMSGCREPVVDDGPNGSTPLCARHLEEARQDTHPCHALGCTSHVCFRPDDCAAAGVP